MEVAGYKFPVGKDFRFSVREVSADVREITIEFKSPFLSLSGPVVFFLISPAFKTDKRVVDKLKVRHAEDGKPAVAIETTAYSIGLLNRMEDGPKYELVKGTINGQEWTAYLKYGRFLREVFLVTTPELRKQLRNKKKYRTAWKQRCVKQARTQGFTTENTWKVLDGMRFT